MSDRTPTRSEQARFDVHLGGKDWIEVVPYFLAEELERDLAAVTAERDALAETLRNERSQRHA